MHNTRALLITPPAAALVNGQACEALQDWVPFKGSGSVEEVWTVKPNKAIR